MEDKKKNSKDVKSNPLANRNPLETVYKLYDRDGKASKDFEGYHDKFRHKTFYESYKFLSNTAYLCAVIGGFLCVGLAFTFLVSLLETALGNYYIAGGIAVVLLLILEFGLKAHIIPLTTRAILERSKTAIILVCVCIAIIAGSMATTLKGSEKLFYVVGTQNGDIRNEKNLVIVELRGQQQTILDDRKAWKKRNPNKSVSWLGDKEMEALNKQIEAIQAEKVEEVKELSMSKQGDTKHLFILSLIFEIVILFCYSFCEFFKWKAYRECAVLNPDLQHLNSMEVGHLTHHKLLYNVPKVAASTTTNTSSSSTTNTSSSTSNTIGFKRNQVNSKCDNGGCCGGVESGCNDVATRDNSDLVRLSNMYNTTGKTLTYQQVKNRLNTYIGFKTKGKRDKGTVNARINYFSFLLDKMEDKKSNRIEEIKFVKADWLNSKKVEV